MSVHNVQNEIERSAAIGGATAIDTAAAGIKADTIAEATAATGVTIDGVKLKDSEVTTDVINEKTAATGVTIDGVLLKDSTITLEALVTATAAELNSAADASARLVNAAAATLAITAATHGNKIVTLNKADGIAVTLPAASATGVIYRFFVGTTITSVGTTIKVANASDTMVGHAVCAIDGGTTNNFFLAGGTDDTITMNGTTTGGYIGDRIELIDIATNLWAVRMFAKATGTEATPFSATV